MPFLAMACGSAEAFGDNYSPFAVAEAALWVIDEHSKGLT